MNPLQFHVNYAVRDELNSLTFSFCSPPIAQQVWANIQDAPDSLCEESILVGDHILRTCFLSLMLKRDLARPNGFFTRVRDLVLSHDIYAALVTKAGLQWRGPTPRPAAEAFLIFVAALHASLDRWNDLLNWFRETFSPLIRAAEASYVKHASQESTFQEDASHEMYSRALDLLGQIKALQLQWQIWNRQPMPTSPSLPKLIWSASTFALKELATFTGAALSPVIRLAGHTLRATIPLKWTRSRKITETLRRKRRVSSILDPRPSNSSRSFGAEALLSSPEAPPTTPSNPPPHRAPQPPTALAPLSASSSTRPYRYFISARLNEAALAPAPTPLRLPYKPSYGLRETSWSHAAPLDTSRRDLL